MSRIKNIEFLRIVGCIAIILLHLCSSSHLYGLFADISLYKKLAIMTGNGQKAVDLFFILSGLFFALRLDTAKSLWQFAKNKLIRLSCFDFYNCYLFFCFNIWGVKI